MHEISSVLHIHNIEELNSLLPGKITENNVKLPDRTVFVVISCDVKDVFMGIRVQTRAKPECVDWRTYTRPQNSLLFSSFTREKSSFAKYIVLLEQKGKRSQLFYIINPNRTFTSDTHIYAWLCRYIGDICLGITVIQVKYTGILASGAVNPRSFPRKINYCFPPFHCSNMMSETCSSINKSCVLHF